MWQDVSGELRLAASWFKIDVSRLQVIFESSESAREKSRDEPVTVAEGLSVYVLILLLAFGSVAAFIGLGDRPYGMQYATLISYSGAIFIWTFFRTKGVNTKHSLSAPYVHEHLPGLLMVHLAYLLALFFLTMWTLAIRPSMTNWWLIHQGRKSMPPFDFAVMLVFMAVAISEIFIARRILWRAGRQFEADSV